MFAFPENFTLIVESSAMPKCYLLDEVSDVFLLSLFLSCGRDQEHEHTEAQMKTTGLRQVSADLYPVRQHFVIELSHNRVTENQNHKIKKKNRYIFLKSGICHIVYNYCKQ